MSKELPVKADKPTIAKRAIRSAIVMGWGPRGWERLDEETREALLLFEIVKYMSGRQWNEDKGIDCQRGMGWTSEDCIDVLSYCKQRSLDGRFGKNLLRMIDDDDAGDVK